ncbi:MULTISPECIES: aldose epimerase family protein [Streptomyces]|uniref:Aldose 1-epimerase n=1 Tax=Streptomyces sviceus (strain ATCC 29083 / DSM 924 / JCM 4929 / NBRC 13980 / NCIMB 11184 / NRRL 5439 / UC 5370) TaxID=463191 RepID=B5I2K2_STRX2|nr:MULTISPECIES: aldose epimerase family protein [Streptomyces]EDY59307.1 galactose mutarotase [Streptomyces sviceus ATCC 29083]MYT05554.1 galactose-1-epimerase [Streptomyces sp. SID5470]
MNELFATLSDGTPVHRWTLERAGVRVRILSYGGIVQSVEVPDRDGRTADVVLGFAGLEGYLEHSGPYLGALVGRYANRIAGGRFELDGATYALAPNNAPNSLHGGEHGFDKRVWDMEPAGAHGVRLSRISPHGEEGFPGRLEVSGTYSLDESGALRIAYEAVTDAPTIVNLTNHSYFNLAGSGNAGGHELRIDASRFTPVDADLIPTGVEEVAGTRFDFRQARKVGAGYDHNFVLDKGITEQAVEVAELYDPASGRLLTVATTEPGLQLYTADHLTEPFAPGDAIALETQHFPDSPNRPEFPSTVLRPGEVYRSQTVYGFGAR